MEWVIVGIFCAVCYALFKLIVFVFSEKGIELSKMKRYLIGWFIVIAAFTPCYFYIDSRAIVDEGVYYVNLFPKNDSQKNYRVPGLITKDEYGYHLYEVYWSNGGSLSFERNSYYTDLIIGKKVSTKDDDNKEWNVELTREKATKLSH